MNPKRIQSIVIACILLLGFAPAAHAQKVIYLTFDLDMSQSMYKKAESTGEKWYNPALFTYLEEQHIPATFFVSGLFAVAYPDLIHSLASSTDYSFENHSYDESSFVSHCYRLAVLKTDQEKINQIQKTEEILKKDTGQTATFFRFPGLCTDEHNNALVQSLGYVIDHSPVIAGDPFNGHTKSIVHAVLTGATSSAVVIMHVGGHNAPRSLAALKQIVPGLREQGYTFGKL